ncbi:MAG: endolytic transglycosylase MltG [Candidatus Korobacteraceae bacterium]|jgi:UPF0755 protein
MRFVLKLVVLVIAGFAAWLGWSLLVPLAPAHETFVLLPPGLPTRQIAQRLEASGVIRSRRAFLLIHYCQRSRTLKAGEYRFDAPQNTVQVFGKLARGEIYTHTVVIPEGFNIYEVAQAIQQAGLGTANDFLAATRVEIGLVRGFDPQAASLEGYLFPDTYQFTRTQSMHDMVQVMVRRFEQESRQIGLTENVHAVVTMASIVEKETAIDSERPLVAGVYYNRLQRQMPLAADPTVVYAALLNQRYRGAIYQSDLQFDSAYNTYKHRGLPPGPIANPGIASLKAAMNPDRSDYLYFVANGEGGHRFTSSYEEHLRNVAALRHRQRQSMKR